MLPRRAAAASSAPQVTPPRAGGMLLRNLGCAGGRALLSPPSPRRERGSGSSVRSPGAGPAHHRGGPQQQRPHPRAQTAATGGDCRGLRQGTPKSGVWGVQRGLSLTSAAHWCLANPIPKCPPPAPPASLQAHPGSPHPFWCPPAPQGQGTHPGVVRALWSPAEPPCPTQVWDDANSRAQELAKTEGWVIIPPFDHPLVWEGHASLVRELKDSLEDKPGAIVVAVGGGGLLAGVVAGLQQVGWQDVPIIAAETLGAHSFHEALKAGRLVTLPDITSVATCLGAKMVAARALECARECQVLSQVVQDAEAVRAVQQFLDDERLLVEPACGAPLAVLYSGRLRRLQSEGRLPSPLRPVLLVVCGGSNIHTAQLRALQSQLGLE
ncbi:serine dehydratase-like isoform X2 [Onychostruthus taczanowskii]|uniref:serine dehydratase-like isoform X2 n=1 Tax=Onychostruthus taczanowskii TaxID=356909 RepID=UPI001B809FB3|nr:serine dehydratase-like isoform X2 [Onychostruthus taczanowskii]